MKKLFIFLLFISPTCFSQYKEFVPGTYYRVNDTVQVSSKNSLFKAVKNFTAYSIPSDNQYWDFAGNMFEERLKIIEKEIVKQKATNLLFSESIAAIEDILDTLPFDFDIGSPYLLLPLSNAKDLTGQSNVIIENVRFENVPGIALKLHGSHNITIRNCFFNKAGSMAIAIENSTNITITNCLFNGVESGVYALNSQTIKVNNNQFVNMRQRRNADGSGAGLGQFVQFNSSGGPGCEIMNNKGENFFGESDPEDMINMYSSSGTAASPILIKGNVFRGGGPSQSGGGILAGDYNGSYITIDGNTLLNPGQYGIAIAGGNNNIVTNNKIFSKQFSWSNIAVYIWAQSGSACSNNTVKGNRASWVNREGSLNVSWNAGNCINTVWENPAPITEAELNVPDHLIDFVTPDELLKIRGK